MDFFKLLFSTIAVIFMILLAYWGTRWISLRYKNMGGDGRYMKVLERASLSQDKQLVLVNLCGKVFMLGVSAQKIETLGSFEEAELKEMPKPQPVKPAQSDFAAIFMDSMKTQLKQLPQRLPFIKTGKGQDK